MLGESAEVEYFSRARISLVLFCFVLFFCMSQEKEILSSLTKFMVEPVSETELAESFDDM